MNLSETTIRRLEQLELNNARFKIAVLVLGGVLALGLADRAWSAGRTKVVEAEGFVLRSADGKVVAELAEQIDGIPELALYDRKGRRRIDFAVLDDGSLTSIFSQTRQRSAGSHYR